MELLDHPPRCVRRRVSRRMTATIDGSACCEVLAGDDLVVGVAPVLGRCALTVEDVHEIVTGIVPGPSGSAAGTED